jgi:hypothetical protein
VKAKLTAAFEAIGDDDAFAAWAGDNPTEFYKLWSKMLPAEVEQTTVTMTQAEREAKAAALLEKAARRAHLKLA